MSRSFDCDDWEISDKVFSILDSILGPHSIDRFASNYNSKCFRFNSRWWLPGAEAVNALDQCWEGECNWMVPPPRLIVLCLSKLKHDRACGTLVVPEWFSAPFWVQLVDAYGVF